MSKYQLSQLSGLRLELKSLRALSSYFDTNLFDSSITNCLEQISIIENFIISIDDSLIRTIFRLRYMRDMTWQSIAFAINETDESYPRRLHNSFLKKLSYA